MRARHASALAVLSLLVLTGLFYLRPSLVSGSGCLVGLDYEQLHIRRIAFAREALFGERHTLPTWYPHEFLGVPFAANLQAFPWIPTRLLLLPLDPSIAYAPGVALAAALSAIFTFLYGRRAGLSRMGAWTAGGTFACAGYFASRVMAGHLPLLEAYPALPLLLWLADRALSPERAGRHRMDLALLAFSSASIAAAGHPQLPAYALASALLYIAFIRRGWVQVRVAGAIGLGVGVSLAVWWPMLLLVGRSTRVLRLAAADNDIAMPYRRLWGLLVPGIDGWPEPMQSAAAHPFVGFPNAAYFWDTSAYIGILPLLAIAALSVRCIVRKCMPDGRWRFLACLGAGAFVCSLPLASPLLHALPGTLFRSPARLLYLSTFCAAAALGAGVDAFRERWPRGVGLAALVLFLHFADLWGFAHLFVEAKPLAQREAPEFEAILDREVGNGRIAEQRDDLLFSYADRYDDAGGFDSILLARFNRGILALAGRPPDMNLQEIDSSELPVKVLEATGVRFVITTETRTDLQLAGSTDEANLYRVANPAPRAEFVDALHRAIVPAARIPELFAATPKGTLFLPADAHDFARHGASDDTSAGRSAVRYERPSSDRMLLRSDSSQPGFVHVLESFDPGWTATEDGRAMPVLPANGFSIAVPVTSGRHEISLQYYTPGRAVGLVLSILSLVLLVALIAMS